MSPWATESRGAKVNDFLLLTPDLRKRGMPSLNIYTTAAALSIRLPTTTSDFSLLITVRGMFHWLADKYVPFSLFPIFQFNNSPIPQFRNSTLSVFMIK
jgi:hypothetical protein